MTKSIKVPWHVKVVAAQAQFGTFQKSFRYCGRMWEWGIVWVFMLIGLVNWPIVDNGGPQDAKIILALALWVPIMALLMAIITRRRQRIYVFDHGMVMTNRRRSVRRVIAWKDVVSLWQKQRNEIYIPTYEEPLFEWRFRMWLLMKDGTRVKFGIYVHDIGRLSLLVASGVGSAQLPALIADWEALDTNQTMQVSGYTISKQGIQIKHWLRTIWLAWSEVTAFQSGSPIGGWFYCYGRDPSHISLHLNGKLNTPATILLLQYIVAQNRQG